MGNLRKGFVGFALVGVLLSFVALGAPKGCELRQESPGEESSVPQVKTDSYTVRNEKQVLAKVAEMGGVPQDLLQESTVKLVSLKEDNTPFLSERIIGRPLWQVTIPKWKLDLPSAIPGFEDRYERTFDILVDPVNGTILKIASRWPQGIPEMAPEPPAEQAEVQMINSGLERYHRFPQDKPAITFLQALDVVLREGSSSPLVAKQIIAHYVVHSKMGGEPRPVWAITFRGIRIVRGGPAPLPGSPPSAHEFVVNRMRDIVDARTGEWLGAGGGYFPPADSAAEPQGEPGQIPSPPPTVTFDLSSPSDGQEVVPGSIIQWTITATVSTDDNFGLALVAVDLVQDPFNPELFDIPPGIPPAGMEDFDRPNGISNPDPGGPGSAYGGTQIGTPGAMDLAQIGGAQNTFGVIGDGIGLDTQVDSGVGQSPGGADRRHRLIWRPVWARPIHLLDPSSHRERT